MQSLLTQVYTELHFCPANTDFSGYHRLRHMYCSLSISSPGVTVTATPLTTIYLGYIFTDHMTHENIPRVCSHVKILGNNLSRVCFCGSYNTWKYTLGILSRVAWNLKTYPGLIVAGYTLAVSPAISFRP